MAGDPATVPATGLTAPQAHALFDILSHHGFYAELRHFKSPDAIANFGPPFQTEGHVESSSPLLQSLFARLFLRLPGLRNADPALWKERVSGLLTELAIADFSESYDRGLIGLRRTIATGAAAVLQYPARGFFGGFAQDDAAVRKSDYDKSDPHALEEAWHHLLQGLVHGDLIDELITATAQTPRLQDHLPLFQAAHEYILIQ